MQNNLTELARIIRHNIVTSTTEAGSGHPSSSLSSVELLTTLMFGGYFFQDLKNPRVMTNDRLVFSKGHAAPLLYSLYAAAGGITQEELMSLRKFGSKIEGHPTPDFKYADVASGSLGMGLSVGLGMALGIKLRAKTGELRSKREPKVFVLMGDSEVAEGQIYEAAEIASFYTVNNLVGILDVNRLGQRGQTMLGWDLQTYQKRFESFGWNAIVIEDGHSIEEIKRAYDTHLSNQEKPTVFIAKTMKGKGVSLLENKDNWHGKAVPKENLEEALTEIGQIDKQLKGSINAPQGSVSAAPRASQHSSGAPTFASPYSTREAYGDALVAIGTTDHNVVVIDGETGNSTFSETFQKAFPDRFFEMYIAEQNMVSDLSMMRSLLNSTVLYPSDPYQTLELIKQANLSESIVYIRTSREKTDVLYKPTDRFKIGGSRVIKESAKDMAVIFAAGITLHESLKAYELLQKEGISLAVVDLYSIKPVDEETVARLAKKYHAVIVAEDHYPYGGIGETVQSVIQKSVLEPVTFTHLCVRKLPHSGAPQELLHFEEIDAAAIVAAVKALK
ncbi:transketolase [Candidatus Microgenomates bacterium]|nr:transketolase [Candidatus Microgenomates bacterium]